MREREENKISFKFKEKYILDNNEGKHSKSNKKENSRKSIKKEREKEKITIENNEKFENNCYNREKNKQSKYLFINNIFKNENFIVNKFIKSQKIAEKKSRSKINKCQLKKKKKKNQDNNVTCCGTDFKIRKISEQYEKNSEKIEISKISETSKIKIETKIIRKKLKNFFEYSKKEKNREQKNEQNNNLEEDNSQENKNIKLEDRKIENNYYLYKRYSFFLSFYNKKNLLFTIYKM